MIPYDDALERMLGAIGSLGSEQIAIDDAVGRFLAEDVTAALDSPRADCSMMDGYAVREADARRGDWLRIIGEAAAGHPLGRELQEGEAARIFTGAHMPRGADCIVIQEEAQREGDRVRFEPDFGPATYIRLRGSDFCFADIVLRGGTRLSPASMVALAAADRARVAVSRLPAVSLIANGDEICAPGSAAATSHAVPDSASLGVAMIAQSCGARMASRHRERDDLPALEELATQALEASDLVVIIGGASVGDRDFAKAMIALHAPEMIFDKVAIRPGKPVWFAKAGGKLVLGLPGNPSSAMVTARLFLVPLLTALQGGSGTESVATSPQLVACDLPASGSRETFVRAHLTPQGLVLAGNQDSGAQAPLAASDWLIRRAPHSKTQMAGSFVAALPF